MSTSRAFTALVAAFVSTGLSVDPWAAPPPPPRPRALLLEQAGKCSLSCPLPKSPAKVASSGIESSDELVPRDVELEIAPELRGGHRVVVRRRGFLVSLRDEQARSAGVDWTAVRVSPRPGPDDQGSAGRLVWETTRLGGADLSTARGLVQLWTEGGSLRGELRAAGAPRPAASWKSQRATCAGQNDGLGGYTVLCRFAKGTRVSGVANVTGARSLDDAWLTPGPSPLARFDLPRSPGGAEGRVIGLTRGATGVVLRVEATFLEGEEPSLQIQETERAQPVAPL
jgi:hypothetical protein